MSLITATRARPRPWNRRARAWAEHSCRSKTYRPFLAARGRRIRSPGGYRISPWSLAPFPLSLRITAPASVPPPSPSSDARCHPPSAATSASSLSSRPRERPGGAGRLNSTAGSSSPFNNSVAHKVIFCYHFFIYIYLILFIQSITKNVGFLSCQLLLQNKSGN